MRHRENWLRTVEYRYPEYIPVTLVFSPLTWKIHREGLENLVLQHPLLFSDFQKGSVDFDCFEPGYREGEFLRDNWGCLWYSSIGGLEGQVVEHPLESWDALEDYQPPDPMTQEERGERDWDAIRYHISDLRSKGELTVGSGERLFDRMFFLRGFENLMMDFATDDPHLPKLIDMLLDYEMRLISEWLKIGVDVMVFHTDIGTQQALMISPEKFRKYLKPMFTKLFRICRKAGSHVHVSSDGCLLEIVDDLIDCGVSMHDPQLRANTLAGIEKVYKGRLCACVDLDRQMTAFCKPDDIDHQVRNVVERMGAPEGGLMVSGSVWDNTPLENIEALCVALERYCLHV